jgi:hypothetical protein
MVCFIDTYWPIYRSGSVVGLCPPLEHRVYFIHSATRWTTYNCWPPGYGIIPQWIIG